MLSEILQKEFREASKITGKNYRDIIRYYHLCEYKDPQDINNCMSPIRLGIVYTELEYYEHKHAIDEEALALTRDYIWFDEEVTHGN
jgi:hypothetical protein